MHEVERRDPTGARESITIDLEQGRTDVDLGKRFTKCCDMFPVNGAAMARHYACTRKYPCPPGDPPQARPAPGLSAEPCEGCLIFEGRRVSSRTHEDVVEPPAVCSRAGQHDIRRQPRAARGCRSCRRRRDNSPAVELAFRE